VLFLVGACAPSASSSGSDTTSAGPESKPARTVAEDSAAVRATLDAWYAALQAVDSAGTLAPLTPQFLLLEDTLPLSGPELLARLQQAGTETKWTAEFSDVRMRFAGDVAWATLRNRETSVDRSGKRCQADFLETIVFVREDKRWLIDRYHAAALHRWACP
jgi:ketosteroid isomerase-like protein